MLKKIAFAWVGIVLAASAPAAWCAEVVDTIEVGTCPPTAVTVDEKGDRVFVLNACDETSLTVISGKDNSTIRTVKIDGRVGANMDGNGMAYNPVSDRLYFPTRITSASFKDSMDIIDAKSYKALKRVPNKKGREGLIPGIRYLGPSKEVLYLEWNGFVRVYDVLGRLKREADTKVVGYKRYAVSKDGGTIYMAAGGWLSSVNARNGAVKNIIQVSTNTTVPLIDDKTGNVFIGDKGKLLKISGNEVAGSIDLGIPEKNIGAAMALNPNTRHLFVQAGGDSVAVVDPDRMEVLSRLDVGGTDGDAKGIAVNTVTNRVYVSCMWGKKVVVIKDE